MGRRRTRKRDGWTLGAALLLLAACDTETRFPSLGEFTSVDPAKYERQIRPIEELVFTDGPPGTEGRDALATRLDGLAELLAAREQRPPAPIFARELRVLAELARRVPPDAPIENGPLREQWLRIRGSLFDDAAWFAYGPRDLGPRPVADNPLLVPGDVVAALRSALDQADDAARRMPDELAELVGPDPAGEPASAETWSAWTEEWRLRLDDIESQLPPTPGPFANPFLRSALADARGGLGLLRVTPRHGEIRSTGDLERWQDLLRRAAEPLARARASAARIGQR
ncbi:MAG: hypothetical protein KBD01_20340 [Acidobacteria bacterium]|nr:hypothetical protein [Acidobacteriota bacterium]